MLDFENSNASFLICPNFSDDVMSYLYSKSYSIFPIHKIEGDKTSENYICINNSDNISLLSDSSKLINDLDVGSVIIKYFEDSNIYEVLKGNKRLVEVKYYSEGDEDKYLHDNYVFSFVSKKMYSFPKEKSDLKEGMIVECLSNNNWIKKSIGNVSLEYDKIYKLLIKYNKVRIPL